jgi:hypothetical protein
MAMLRRLDPSALRILMKCLVIANSEREKVRKTLIEYMTTRAEMEPLV